MKILNVGKRKGTIFNMKAIDVTDRQPCWCAKLDTEGFEPKWIISVKKEGEDIEHSFSLPNSNHKLYSYMLSYDFAMKLIEIFRWHGIDVVTKWVDDMMEHK